MLAVRTIANRRWSGLDAFRGLAVIGMLLVNNPGNRDAVYAQLRHSAWHGCTIADLVFPFFLFVVGITTTISLAATAERGDAARLTGRIWRRAALIFGIGLLLNWFPFYQSGAIPFTDHPGFIDRVIARLLTLRVPGVLQRIAVCYLIAALIARRASWWTIATVATVLLLGYWALLSSGPINDPSRTIDAAVDRAIFDWTRWGLGNHLWEDARTWDPEGALSTLGALGTALLGVLCGRWMLARSSEWRLREIAAAGLACVAVGWMWSFVLPLNKALWTSSYVLYTAGIAMLGLGVLVGLLDGGKPSAWRWWARPLIIFGENPLIAYAGSELGRHILHSSIKLPASGGRLGTDEWVARQLATLGLSANAASLGWSLLYVALWLFVLSRLSRRRLFVRA